MRIHSNIIITAQQVQDALKAEQAAGRIARSVGFKILTQHRSQSRATAFEVQLESVGKVAGDGRRVGASGAYVNSQGSNLYAATFDEWGFLLSALFDLDNDLTCTYYKSAADFDERTGHWYSADLADSIANAEGSDDCGDPMPWVSCQRSGGSEPRVGKIGKVGSIRRYSDYEYDQLSRHAANYAMHAPRTSAEVRAFQRRDSA